MYDCLSTVGFQSFNHHGETDQSYRLAKELFLNKIPNNGIELLFLPKRPQAHHCYPTQ